MPFIRHQLTASPLGGLNGCLLNLGNFLNHGSFRGNASGFKLDTLAKLSTVRSNDPRNSAKTLLHYLANWYQKGVLFNGDGQESESGEHVNVSALR